jgi:prepilin-type N-terminal cleavage/methylation domain-containing protein
MYNIEKIEKNKKLKPGMTLVEVIIAMAVFSSATLAITVALAGALKYNVRNTRRDSELNKQQSAVEKNTAAGVSVRNNSINSAKTLKFTAVNGDSVSITGINQYQAIKSEANSEDFNFQIKTFSSTPLGSTKVKSDKSANQFKITFLNNYSKDVDVKVTINGGKLYEGDPSTGYVHSSSTYTRTVNGTDTSEAAWRNDAVLEESDEEGVTASVAPTGFSFGYENSAISSVDVPITITITGDGVNYVREISSSSLLISENGTATITLDASGNMATVPTYS